MMSSWDFMPGINNVFISKSGVITQDKDKLPVNDVNINLDFTLFGLNRLVGPIENDKRFFYVYIFLVYYEGGRNFEIISSAQIYCDESILENDSVQFSTNLTIPDTNIYPDADFILNYYSLEIAYSERAAEDGSDINGMLKHSSTSLFSTKLDVGIESE